MAHYYDAAQETPLRAQKITFTARQRQFSATTGGGVFSKDGLDNATRLLIESVSLKGDERVLDLGCGWGPVGLVLHACFPKIDLLMTDVNLRAVSLSKKNVPGVSVRVSDGFAKIDELFDVILTNPPYAAGRDVCYRFIEESLEHLGNDGVFLLVARHQKGGKMLEQKIKDVFGEVETVAKGGGFRVYKGKKE